MIEVTDVEKWYGTTHALRGVSFSVDKGEVVGLLGPNGAGKTTMMRLLTGYLQPSAGTLKVADVPVNEDPIEAKKKVGYLPEVPPLYDDMAVRSYVEFVAELKGVPKKEVKDRAQQAMERTGCQEVAHRLIGHISKGYRQRVGIAQAVVHNPDVVILDEPTIGLDPRQIIEIRNLIKSLGKQHTVLLSSHILSEVSATCQRVMIIHRGQIVAIDTQERLMERARGARRFKVTFKSRKKEAEALLQEAGLNHYSVASETSDTISLDVEMKQDQDLREELFFKAAESKLPILELTPEALTLEEVFLQLTKEEA